MSFVNNILNLANTFGVVGDVQEIGAAVKKILEPYVDNVQCDQFGNLVGRRCCGLENAPKLFIETGITQQSFLVTEISEEGFLYFLDLGQSQWPMLGHEVRIKTRSGAFLSGVIAAPPPAQEAPLALSDLVIDTGLAGAEAKKHFHVGDHVVLASEAFALNDNLLCGGTMSARIGFSAVLHALGLLKNCRLPVDLIIAVSAGKEGACDVAWRESPAWAVCVDAYPDTAGDEGGQEIKLGEGPVIAIGPNSSPAMARRMAALAAKGNLPCQLVARGASCGDSAWQLQTCGYGIETLAVSVPVKYLHTPAEVVCTKDIIQLGALLAAFIVNFEGGEEE